MEEKELTPRQIHEQAAYEADKAQSTKKKTTAADVRNFYRKQAGWPVLKVNP